MAISLDKVRNIGISAHIDSGKTTLSERILFYTGKIQRSKRSAGRSGVGAKMDSMDLEREKGITIQSAATYCEWDGLQHQPHRHPRPRRLHHRGRARAARPRRRRAGPLRRRACSRSRTPSTARCAATTSRAWPSSTSSTARAPNPARVTAMLKEKLRHNTITTQLPIGDEDEFEAIIDLIRMKAFYFDGDDGEDIREEEIPADRLEEAKTAPARHDRRHRRFRRHHRRQVPGRARTRPSRRSGPPSGASPSRSR